MTKGKYETNAKNTLTEKKANPVTTTGKNQLGYLVGNRKVAKKALIKAIAINRPKATETKSVDREVAE